MKNHNIDPETYEGYLEYCRQTNGEPYSRNEWEKMTGIHEDVETLHEDVEEDWDEYWDTSARES